MLPTPLQGTYQQYKADTDSVAAWLASTAKHAVTQLIYSPPLLYNYLNLKLQVI
ncbi:uncharacterized protein BKA55DRAFT_378070 [Fusarium redolens]|uniref:Uncharacterized protein n=1 Tax=Fusarium redolens TaxID=48865 RepID=A0A9P9KAP6_FUSRE|nr:uncharacterized protein BKA55DRAFT_378070 [Fusarium redolens]KAH7250350.1 hypothetical protein BKA55DRAFT_378070 [Fusarium redolens]